MGLDKACIAVENLERNSGGKLSIGVFKGAENLIPPDAMLLLYIHGLQLKSRNGLDGHERSQF